MISKSFSSLRIVKVTRKSRNAANPIIVNLCSSESEWEASKASMFHSSKNAETASSNEMPRFLMFSRFLFSSHSNSISDYTDISIQIKIFYEAPANETFSPLKLKWIPCAASLPICEASTASAPPLTQSPPAKIFGFDVCIVSLTAT